MWADVKAVAEAAVENFVAMRAAEGEKLRADILSRLVYLEQAVGEIEQTSAERVQKYTEKLYAKLKALLEDTNIDEARILTEAAILQIKRPWTRRRSACAATSGSIGTFWRRTSRWVASWIS